MTKITVIVAVATHRIKIPLIVTRVKKARRKAGASFVDSHSLTRAPPACQARVETDSYISAFGIAVLVLALFLRSIRSGLSINKLPTFLTTPPTRESRFFIHSGVPTCISHSKRQGDG